MDERNHLELRQIAEQASDRIRQVTDSLSELRANYDGPAIADNISEIEIVYTRLSNYRMKNNGSNVRGLWHGHESVLAWSDFAKTNN